MVTNTLCGVLGNAGNKHSNFSKRSTIFAIIDKSVNLTPTMTVTIATAVVEDIAYKVAKPKNY